MELLLILVRVMVLEAVRRFPLLAIVSKWTTTQSWAAWQQLVEITMETPI